MRAGGGDGIPALRAGGHFVTEEAGSDQMREIIFEVTEALEGGYDARALGHSVFTQGDDRDDLKDIVRDAVLCHFDDREMPTVIRLRFVREEAIGVFLGTVDARSSAEGRPDA